MEIRKATKKDVKAIVAIHMERFSNFFLTSLGTSFLTEFYKAFLKNKAILLVLEDRSVVRGFAAGSYHNRGFFKQLILSNIFGFSIVGLRILLTKPQALKRMLRKAGHSEKNNLIFAELLSIATLKNNKGYGAALLSAFEQEVKKNNPENGVISLTTDFHDNEKTIQFYFSAGYEVMEIFETYEHRKMYRMVKNIN